MGTARVRRPRKKGSKAKTATSIANAFVTNIVLARGRAHGKRSILPERFQNLTTIRRKNFHWFALYI
ncbi:hypothetical protein [Lentibacillus persicus]|uniref:hypothetical protein n=1 Tax=Lentibacillus persicus TaxID=640948 RepID=UPI001C42F53F|nr:hypothetical protein [Lentibacillus persicus]